MKTLWKLSQGPGNTRIIEADLNGSPIEEVLSKAGNAPILLDLREADPHDKELVSDSVSAKRMGEIQLAVAGHVAGVTALLSGEYRGALASLALACSARVASPAFSISFPEVSLGLLPPGETLWKLASLCRLGDLFSLLLTGQKLDVWKAKALGLVDAVTQESLLISVGASLKPKKSRPVDPLLRRRVARFFLKRQALSELTSRGAPRSSTTAIKLLFKKWGKGPHQRIEEVASSIEKLRQDPEHRRLVRIAELRDRYLPKKTSPPSRCLVIAGEQGWRWTCLLAHCGSLVRWAWKDEKVLGEGLCWLRRDTERYFADSVDKILRRVTVSVNICGFAGRDLVLVEDPELVKKEILEELAVKEKVILIGSVDSNLPQIRVPSDPLTSSVCTLQGAPEGLREKVEQLGFLIVSEPEAECIFQASRAFSELWKGLIEEGFTPKQIVASLRRYGFSVRTLLRRYQIFGKLPKRSSDEVAQRFVDALRIVVSGFSSVKDLVELAMHLEFGFPAHKSLFPED